jgi:hypothetical protein
MGGKAPILTAVRLPAFVVLIIVVFIRPIELAVQRRYNWRHLNYITREEPVS